MRVFVHDYSYLAITSTYPLPFFPFLTVPPLRACGAPIRSSMLLALLMLVGGLDGGADGGPEGGPETDRIACCGASASDSPTGGARTAGEGGRD